jgi:hypothetical protein
LKKSPNLVQDGLNNLKIVELKSIIKNEGIDLPKPRSGELFKKSFLISTILDHRYRENGVEEIKISSFKCGSKKNKCSPKACSVESGDCLPVLTTGELYNSVKSAQKQVHGKDYYFDKDSGLVGREVDVKDHIKHWNSSKSQSDKLNRSKSKDKRRCDLKINPSKCDDDQLCSASTGDCVLDTDSYRKGKYILNTDGRLIVGNKDTIEKLHDILGGNITIADKIKEDNSPKKSSAKKSSAKKSSAKKSPTKKSPGMQSKIDNIISEDEDEDEVLLENKLKEIKSDNTYSSRNSSSFKLGETRNDIYETFSKCLASLE